MGRSAEKRHSSAKLTDEQVREIKGRLDGDESLADIADDYPVHRGTIYNISTGRVYGDV